MDTRSFGLILRELRERRFSQEELAWELRVSTVTIRSWEHDRSLPQRDRQESLLKVLGRFCTTDELNRLRTLATTARRERDRHLEARTATA